MGKINVCGEIEYESREVGGMVHSDICLAHGHDIFAVSPEYRQFLHACLDEWIDKSRGTGMFWIGDPMVRAVCD